MRQPATNVFEWDVIPEVHNDRFTMRCLTPNVVEWTLDKKMVRQLYLQQLLTKVDEAQKVVS